MTVYYICNRVVLPCCPIWREHYDNKVAVVTVNVCDEVDTDDMQSGRDSRLQLTVTWTRRMRRSGQ